MASLKGKNIRVATIYIYTIQFNSKYIHPHFSVFWHRSSHVLPRTLKQHWQDILVKDPCERIRSCNYIKHWVIIFTDAAFFNGRACCAGIAKNAAGSLLSWFKKMEAASAAQAEAKALLLAIMLAIERKWSLVVPPYRLFYYTCCSQGSF